MVSFIVQTLNFVHNPKVHVVAATSLCFVYCAWHNACVILLRLGVWPSPDDTNVWLQLSHE